MAGQDCPDGGLEDAGDGADCRPPANLDGDGQGDLQGHGGEQRAIMVYQLESYRYWAKYLGRSDLAAGNFGENLTVEGLADNEVCIGDRFRIGKARCRRSVILSSDGCASNNLAISAEPALAGPTRSPEDTDVRQ